MNHPALPGTSDQNTSGASGTSEAGRQTRALWLDLAPLCALVFAEFLAMGLPLPVLPLYLHDTLGFGSFVVGLVIGVQSWATLGTRHLAGGRSDRRGAKGTALWGLIVSAGAGVAYAFSTAVKSPEAALALLSVGRALLGFGESLVITGALAWGVALAGRARTGVVMSWIGMAMYGAMAAGAPLGAALHARSGFLGMALAAGLAPLLGLGFGALVRAVPAVAGPTTSFGGVMRAIWLPGAGLSLGALGFGALAAFSPLLFAERGWPGAPLLMVTFGASYIIARLFFGKLPDRMGGARVAAGAAAFAALGHLGITLAPSSIVALVAAGLAGFGFSLAFPSFGVEAMRRVPPQSRGVALGVYTAFFDATLGFGVPALGLIVGERGYGEAFALSALAALGSLFIALRLGGQAHEQTASQAGRVQAAPSAEPERGRA